MSSKAPSIAFRTVNWHNRLTHVYTYTKPGIFPLPPRTEQGAVISCCWGRSGYCSAVQQPKHAFIYWSCFFWGLGRIEICYTAQTQSGILGSFPSSLDWKKKERKKKKIKKCLQSLNGKIPFQSVCRKHNRILPDECFSILIYHWKLRLREILLLPGAELKLT